MTNQNVNDESRWLLSPLQPKEMRVFIAVAEDAELTPEIRIALEALAAAMQAEGADVQGYALSGQCTNLDCVGFSCTGHTCLNLTSSFTGSLNTGILNSLGNTNLSFGLFR